jgi:nitroimidazol reductase NimA-like FMN-containing flavoprotein (pyridoxamine 5'-phosphate oxidase superfamily)
MTETYAATGGEGFSPEGAPVLSKTPRTRHRRLREQGRTERGDLLAVLHAGFIAHLGVLTGDAPMVVPTSYGFDDQTLFLHGSVASQSLRTDRPASVCVTITLVDGLVLARSVFDHAVNYRSAMIYGVPRLVTDPDEKLYGLRLLSERLAPGQWDYARQPLRKELAATALLALPLDEASVKVRSGPPDDAESPDAPAGLWAGVLPLNCVWGEPESAPEIPAGVTAPGHIAARAGTPAFGRPAGTRRSGLGEDHRDVRPAEAE